MHEADIVYNLSKFMRTVYVVVRTKKLRSCRKYVLKSAFVPKCKPMKPTLLRKTLEREWIDINKH